MEQAVFGERDRVRKSSNPLEPIVQSLEENSNYLTPDLCARILQILPERADTRTPESDLSLESLMQRLGRMVRNLETLTSGSDAKNVSGTDIKNSINAAKDLINLVAKHGQAISSEKKVDILRKTIVEALGSVNEPAKIKFLELWEKGLKKAAEE